MSASATYPKRLIEVDLPIKRISAHARREKSIRHGHISTLHIWWARRPLASCRAVICAALWPDPADPLCPDAFRLVARARMHEWAEQHLALVSRESYPHFNDIRNNPAKLDHDDELLRTLLLDFIADFANWDNSTSEPYLETSRALTQAAHEALGGEPGSRPLVVDPFAGGGAIPLEALRVGADAFASDLNPVAVLLNKVVLEYIPKYGQRLADEVRKWGQWVKEEAEKELAEFYPKDPDGATPIAYLWARTIRCEGPGCGAEVPLMRSLWLAKRSKNAVALRLAPNHIEKQINFEIIHDAKAKEVGEGTMRKGAATCPVCGYTTPNVAVRRQLAFRRGGTPDARLFCTIAQIPGAQGRHYRLPTQLDLSSVLRAKQALQQCVAEDRMGFTQIPNEIIPSERPSPNARGLSAVTRIGIATYGDLFIPRQTLALLTLQKLVRRASQKVLTQHDSGISEAVATCLALAVDRQVDSTSSLSRWNVAGEKLEGAFARQALQIVWDFAEVVAVSDATRGFPGALDWVLKVLDVNASWLGHEGIAVEATATHHPLPDSTAQALITDPPYYDSVPYADLADFFYVWLRRTLLPAWHVSLFDQPTTPKDEEAIWNPSRISSITCKPKDEVFYETQMNSALTEGHRFVTSSGIGVVVFAHKSTAGWESLLFALTQAGWTVVASWPIDTEMGARMNAMGTASLASSVHLVCRPRESSLNNVAEWRDVLAELPQRIHEWMPRLVGEGVVGADAIFACLGPAVEIFSRYERVERTDGTPVTLRDYLPHVWAAVSREALSTIFDGADATGFEEDARLTALWLWTLFGGQVGQSLAAVADTENEDGNADEEDDATAAKKPPTGSSYVLEFDAARKLAQGLGAHLEKLATVVEVKSDKARLLAVAERARLLFGKESTQPVVTSRRRSAVVQAVLPGLPSTPHQSSFGELLDDVATAGGAVDEGWIDTSTPEPGGTVLDRLHQGMLLFAAGQTEALRRFLIENGIGQDERFWRLAQALSALYPMGSDEKRWVDGVLARKKGWGL